MTEQMLRYNQGKPRLGLLPTSLIRAITAGGLYENMPIKLLDDTAAVLTFGASKYAPNNWRKAGPWSISLDCAMRHMHKMFRKEELDPESGIHHAAHVACNIGFLLEFIAEGDGQDDRYKTKSKISIGNVDAPDLNTVYVHLLAWKDGDDHRHLTDAVVVLSNWYEKQVFAPAQTSKAVDAPGFQWANPNAIVGEGH